MPPQSSGLLLQQIEIDGMSGVGKIAMAPGRRHRSQRPTEPHSELILSTRTDDTIPTPSSSVASTGSRRGRGRTKNVALLKKIAENGGRPLPIVIPTDLWVPVGEYCSVFKAELGIIARMYATTAVAGWEDVTGAMKLQWYTRVRQSFDINLDDGHTMDAVNKYLQARLRAYKHELHKHYMRIENPRDNPPPGVSQDDWYICCERYSSDKFQIVSQQNVVCRSMQKALYTGGSMSFAEHRHNMLKDLRSRTEESSTEVVTVTVTVTDVSPIDLYYKTHYNPKTGRWGNQQAHDNHDRMVQMKSQPTPDGSTPQTDKEIFDEVLGHRPGYAMGLGHVVVVSSSKSASHTTCEVRVREANEWAEQAIREAEQAKKDAEAMKEKLLTMEERMDAFNALLDSMNAIG